MPGRPHGRGRRPVALVVMTALAVAAGGCGGDRAADRPAGAGPSASPSGFPSMPADIMEEARLTVGMAYKGTYRPPDATPRPAAKGKKLVIISGGQASLTNSVPVGGAAEAARALGWQVQVIDLQLNRANAPRAVKEAIAAAADAIVVNFDCLFAPSELAEANAKGIKLIGMYSFDCDEPSPGRAPGQPQFNTRLNYGVARVDARRFIAGFGAFTANLFIAATNGTAKVISFTDPSETLWRYIEAGFVQQMTRCKGCAVLETVEFTAQDMANGRLLEKATAALNRHPEANAVRTPFSGATHGGIAAAIVKSGRHHSTLVVGGEGVPEDLDLIRTRQGLSSLFIVDTVWAGWSTVDALNSAFVGEEPRVPGFGSVLVDREHNLPPSGPVQHNVDFKSVYRKAWGVA